MSPELGSLMRGISAGDFEGDEARSQVFESRPKVFFEMFRLTGKLVGIKSEMGDGRLQESPEELDVRLRFPGFASLAVESEVGEAEGEGRGLVEVAKGLDKASSINLEILEF